MNQQVSNSNIVGQNTYTTTTTNQQYVGGNQVGSGVQYGQQQVGGYAGQTSYSSVPQTDYKLVNETYQSNTGYSQLGNTLTQKVVAEEIPVESRI